MVGIKGIIRSKVSDMEYKYKVGDIIEYVYPKSNTDPIRVRLLGKITRVGDGDDQPNYVVDFSFSGKGYSTDYYSSGEDIKIHGRVNANSKIII